MVLRTATRWSLLYRLNEPRSWVRTDVSSPQSSRESYNSAGSFWELSEVLDDARH
jgi:hypothetical protein